MIFSNSPLRILTTQEPIPSITLNFIPSVVWKSLVHTTNAWQLRRKSLVGYGPQKAHYHSWMLQNLKFRSHVDTRSGCSAVEVALVIRCGGVTLSFVVSPCHQLVKFFDGLSSIRICKLESVLLYKRTRFSDRFGLDTDGTERGSVELPCAHRAGLLLCAVIACRSSHVVSNLMLRAWSDLKYKLGSTGRG